jgi:glutaminyl-peptide cyclotransferase
VLSVLLLMSSLPNVEAKAGSRTHKTGRQSAVVEAERKTAFEGERAYAHVSRLVGLGPRPAGSKQLARAREYIVRELKSYKLKVSEDQFEAETPAGKLKMVNITAELKGTSDKFIIISSHYDTKLYKDFAFVGANDGGASSGALLELARTLAAQKRPRIGYRFVFFDGEEAVCNDWDECGKPGAPDNTYGSRHYVERLRERGELKRLRALILLDMVGYTKLDLGRDDMSTPWLVEIIWRTAHEIGYSKQFPDREEGVGGDDHEPFLKAGVPSVDLIQLSTYPHWHTPEDTLDKISAASLQAVGDVVISSLPRIEDRLLNGTKTTEKPFELIKTDRFEGVIVPAQYETYMMCRKSTIPCKRWAPSKEEVLQLEKNMEAYLRSQSTKVTPRIINRLAGYKRQYIGFVEDGRRKIQVHSFYEGWGGSLDWRKDIVLVFDGGDDFFDVIYDVTSGTFSDFGTNGYA